MSDVTIEWEQSPTVGALFAALSKAQGMIKAAPKSADNPFFKSRYADLATIMDACRDPLAANELCILQQPFTRGNQVGLRTQLGHSSGEWTACVALVTPKDGGPQAFGSCASYLRRYSLAAVTGVVTEDDDGETAEGRDKNAKPPGANWGPKSAPKAAAPATTGAPSRTANSNSKPLTTGPTTATADTGEILDPGQLADLTEAFEARWGKGARTAAPSWIKAKFGTDRVDALTKVQANEALGELLASAS